MQILFQYTFEHPIWRLVPSISSPANWVVELRNATEKQVIYYSISSEFKITELSSGLDWWSGVECVTNNCIIFHNYLQQDLPIHNGIKVFDAFKNILLWENEFLSFAFATDHLLIAKPTIGSSEKLLTFNLFNGIESSENPIQEPLPNLPPITLISEEDEYFNDIAGFISKYTPFKAVRNCEYFENEKYIIISYCTYNDKKLDNYLLVTDLDGTECLHLCLNEKSSGISAGSYHVSNGLLSFVKDKKELFILEF